MKKRIIIILLVIIILVGGGAIVWKLNQIRGEKNNSSHHQKDNLPPLSKEQELAWDKLVHLRAKCSNNKICKSKSEVLEFLKNNDPALIDKF